VDTRATSRRALALVLLATAFVLAACTDSASRPSGARPATSTTGPPPAAILGHSGRFLTDASGQVVILHGLDMVSKVPPYEPAAAGFGAVAARSLASNGFDVVRLGVIYSAVEPEPGVLSAAYVGSIARTVATLAAQGIYSLLDFHQDQMSVGFGGEGWPAWAVETDGLPVKKFVFPFGYTGSSALNAAFDNVWADRPGPGGISLQQRYAEAWRYVAVRFARDPWVLGYDLINEPWPAKGSDAQLGAFYRRVISAIRSVDRRHLIFYEPYVLFDYGEPTTLPDLGDAHLGMSFHDYCPTNPASHARRCATEERLPIENALARSARTGDALVMTEFGATDDLAVLRRVVALADDHGISWIEWDYCGCDDPTGTIPASVEGLVADPALPATGGNVDAAKLAVLSAPSPRLVSGTPQSYAFDDLTRTFRFAYSTTGPGGVRFDSGSCTAILIPPDQYPAGYTVDIAGARVTSAADAGVLTLAQLPPGAVAGRVTVEVRPGTGGRTTPPSAKAIAACS
jgi:endoglycosylceramidase